MILSLCGYMGAGKTTVARELAKMIGYDYIDLDIRIEEAEGMSTSQIFRQSGEGYFRQLEREHIENLADLQQNLIISLGGGSIIEEDNRNLIKSHSTLIYLKVPFEECYGRIINSDRPIVSARTKEELEKHYNARLSAYEDSDYVVDGTDIVSDVAKNIINLLKMKY